MKCIHEKCKYCSEHDFRMSYNVCNLTSVAFPKKSDIECQIYIKIDILEQKLAQILNYEKIIKENQKEDK